MKRDWLDELLNETGSLYWFQTLPSERERAEHVRRLRAEWQYQRERELARARWRGWLKEQQREAEVLSRIPDAEETFWSLEMREHTRMAYRSKRKQSA